jgi:hypothetical protein
MAQYLDASTAQKRNIHVDTLPGSIAQVQDTSDTFEPVW